MKTILISVVFLLIAVFLLGIKVFTVKGAKFPSGHVHDNEKLKEKGINCHKQQ